MLNLLSEIDWSSPNLHWVLAGSSLLGVAAAVLGCFAFLRGRSLMGDALAHAALPGVCLAFMLAELARARNWFDLDSKNLWLLLIGAGLTGALAAWCINFISRHSRIKEDGAQAIILSVFFGAGIVLLTMIQGSESGNQSGLDRFLFGQAALMIRSDVVTMAVVATMLCALVALFYKELKLLCFDFEFGRGQGFPMRQLDGLLLVMIVVSVVIGLQAVGVVLISALLILPPAAARFWTEKLNLMVPAAAILGGLSGALGAIFSATAPQLPTGPLIVLAATTIFIISLLFAPQRGMAARAWRVLSTRRQVQRENALRDLFELTEKKVTQSTQTQSIPAQSTQTSSLPSVSLDELLEGRRRGVAALRSTLHDLNKRGWLESLPDNNWRLTQTGAREAYRVVRNHRMWEMFLMYETSLGVQTVDRNADAVEHFLSPDAVEQLEELLRHSGLEPRLKPLEV